MPGAGAEHTLGHTSARRGVPEKDICAELTHRKFEKFGTLTDLSIDVKACEGEDVFFTSRLTAAVMDLFASVFLHFPPRLSETGFAVWIPGQDCQSVSFILYT